MPTYQITGVAEAVRDWSSQLGGAMKGYRIDLKAPDGTEELLVEWSRKAASPSPTVGMQVEGEVEQGQYGKKFKKAQGAGFNGSRPEDPKRSARIQRMHSQDMAMRAIEIAQHMGFIESFENTAALLNTIARTADWFDKDAQAAGDRA